MELHARQGLAGRRAWNPIDGIRFQSRQNAMGTGQAVPFRPLSLSSPFPIDSTPPGADIEIDGRFVGNTPSTVSVAAGSHQIAVKKKGFTGWSKTLNVTGGTVHLIAELEQEPAKQ
jgi:hypothetical protein